MRRAQILEARMLEVIIHRGRAAKAAENARHSIANAGHACPDAGNPGEQPTTRFAKSHQRHLELGAKSGASRLDV